MKKQNFIQIVNSNRGTIRSLCKSYYVGIEDQKDAFQDIVLQLWKSFDTFRGESEISTWIYAVGLNTILSRIRREKKSVVTEPIDPSENYYASAKSDDDIELLHIIIQSLKDLDKAIVILYLEGYGNKDIAKILKVSPSNVSTRLNRVRSELKEKFKSKHHAVKRT